MELKTGITRRWPLVCDWLKLFQRLPLLAIFLLLEACTFYARISALDSQEQNSMLPPTDPPSSPPTTPPSDSDATVDLTKISITVEPTYPTNGRNWNDYVLADGTDSLSASGTACDGIQKCIHGAEHKKIVLNVKSCDGLKASDNLNAFYWICKSDGSKSTFYSVGLKEGKGLVSLIQANTWISMSVRIFNSSSETNSALEPWWTNTITPLSDNAGTFMLSLSNQGTIYTLNASRESMGFHINAAKVSLVVAPGAVLSYGNGAANNCNSTTGGMGPGADRKCLITSGSINYLWIEGAFQGLSLTETNIPDHVLFFRDSNYLNIRNAIVSGATSHGIFLDRSKFSSILDTSVAYTLSNANIEIDDSEDVTIARTKSTNGDQGLYIANGTRIRVVQFMALHHNGYPIEFDGCNDSSSVAASIFGSAYVGHDAWFNTDFLAHNILSGNNANAAVSGTSLTNSYFSQISSFDSPKAFEVTSSSGIKIAGNFFFSNNTDQCGVSSLTGSEIDNTCNVLNGAPAQVRTFAIPFGSLIVGQVNSDTKAAITGVVNFPAAGSRKSIDWFSFDSFFRGLGIEDVPAPSSLSPASRGRFSAGVGRIYDYRLKSSAGAFLNSSNSMNAPNSPVVANQDCPIELASENIIQFNGKKYLKNAIEVSGLSIGNNNGLCEDNEVCLYTPNYGAYQGDGSYWDNQCIFTNSSLSNSVKDVKIYFYPSNGI